MEITAATPEDTSTVVALLGELADELHAGNTHEAARIKSLLDADVGAAFEQPETSRFFLALEGGERAPHPIGLARADILSHDPVFRLRADHRCGYIDQMYVRRRFRGQGVGAALLHTCENWLRSLELTHVLLHAAPSAVEFYARDGYLPNRQLFKRLR